MRFITLFACAILSVSCEPQTQNEVEVESVEEIATTGRKLPASPGQYKIHGASKVWILVDQKVQGTFERVGGSIGTQGDRIVGGRTKFFFDPNSFASEDVAFKEVIAGFKGDGKKVFDPNFELARIQNRDGKLHFHGKLRFGKFGGPVEGQVKVAKVAEKSAVFIGEAQIPPQVFGFLPSDKTCLIRFKIHSVLSPVRQIESPKSE